ncbi:MAG: UDP-N-acetylmuramate dehydrogenase [Bacteroidales bacterium]|nr:UDP-N-acetylmuramate dehydrogenase [Bacteroidales bacterium]
MILHNIDLQPLHTFGIHAVADTLITVGDTSELSHILPAIQQAHGLLILGGGSNTVFTGNYRGTVLHMANTGIRLVRRTADGHLIVEADAGVVWDSFVQHCIDHCWYGLENLAAIPGTVGAAPVQNVGAYGADASQFVHCVHAVEIQSGKAVDFSNADCRFGYRDSRFKQQPSQYLVTSVEFMLNDSFEPNLSYKALAEHLHEKGMGKPTARQLADGVAELRWSKLPRPEVQGSAGSFFKNPVVDNELCRHLQTLYPDMPAHKTDTGYKLSAGWLIEKAGWKGRTLGTVGTYARNALVLCNCGTSEQPCSGHDLRQLAATIINEVQRQFNVNLHPEAIII